MAGIITVERESVCMGDDLNAPNTTTVSINDEMHLSTVLWLIEDKMPLVNDKHTIVWSVHTDDRNGTPLGMFEIDDMKPNSLTLFVLDQTMKEMSIKKVFCRYFHNSSLPEYSECPTLGLKVMKHLKVSMKK